MAKIEILMPHMGESIIECTVLKWLVNEGAYVKVDDMILEVATDKIDTEIGSSHEGILIETLVKEGEIAEIGKPICVIETALDEIKIESTEIDHKVLEILEKPLIEVKEENKSERFYSPLVLNIAKTENISKADLEKISGTGQNGRLTKDDLLAHISKKIEIKVEAPVTIRSQNGSDTILEMDRMRKMIAERMVESKRTSAHVTSFIETDMTRLVKWRDHQKEIFRSKYHTGGLTFTPLMVEAVVHAIKKYPGINVQVHGDNIIYKKDINIGVAVALPNGNLIVPVIQKADTFSTADLALKVNDLATRARNNKLKPEELQGGTFTISNIGSFGNIAGTPIIMQPQVAIMAFGVIRKMPAVLETADGDVIAIRQKMIISHSYDHRVVDGSLGGLFLKEVSDYLENFDISKSV